MGPVCSQATARPSPMTPRQGRPDPLGTTQGLPGPQGAANARSGLGDPFCLLPLGPINIGNYISPLLLLGSQKYKLFLPALAVSNNSSSPW